MRTDATKPGALEEPLLDISCPSATEDRLTEPKTLSTGQFRAKLMIQTLHPSHLLLVESTAMSMLRSRHHVQCSVGSGRHCTRTINFFFVFTGV